MLSNKNKFPLLTNPIITKLNQYTNQINEFLEQGCFTSDYKTYDKEDKKGIKYICFDIHSNIENKGMYLKDFHYEGYLAFTYNLIKNTIYIEKLPSYQEDNNITVFTSDILAIILKIIQKYGNIENIKITFENPYQLMAIDNKLEELLPQIKDNINYNRMVTIFNKLKLEEEKLNDEVLVEKRKRDKEENIREKVLAKKSIIYGIDQRNYENYLEYLDDVNKRICEVCDYKINNIKRHLEANKRKYISNLKDLCDKFLDINKILFFSHDYLYEHNIPEEVQEQIDEYCEEKYGTDYIDDEVLDKYPDATKDVINFFFNASFEYDSNVENEDSLISIILYLLSVRQKKDEIYELRTDGYYGARSPMIFYTYILRGEIEEGNYFFEEKYCVEKYKSLLFAKSIDYPMENIKKAIDLLIQIHSLHQQLKYYEKMISVPKNALLQFKSHCNNWNSILNYPYWLRLGRDNQSIKEKFYLLMIKPGTNQIDLDNIRIFTMDNGKEFGSDKKSRQEFLQQILTNKEEVLYTDRIMITIPKSLEYDSILKLIAFAKKYGNDSIQYLCETPDVAATLKQILFDKAISEYKNITIYENKETNYKLKIRGKFFREKIFISVDPNYYSNFMIDTPSNKNFWHLYDYTGNYKFRRKEPASFDYVVEKCIQNNTHDGVINYDKISEQVLGNYLGKEKELINIDISEFTSYYSEPFKEILYRSDITYNEEIDVKNDGEIYTYKKF